MSADLIGTGLEALTLEASLSLQSSFDSALSLNPLQVVSANNQLPTPADVEAFLTELEGSLTVTDGFFVADFVTESFGSFNGTVDVVQELNDLATEFATATGQATISGGTIVGDLMLGDDLLTGSLDFAALVSDMLTEALTEIDGTGTLENGELALDVSTPAGDILGTIELSGGQLITDLETPFGDLDSTIDLSAATPLTFSTVFGEATLDFSDNEVTLDLLPSNPGPELVLPLDSLSGTVALDDGVANLSLATPFGMNLDTSFDLVAFVDDQITPFLTAATGTLSLGSGVLTGDVSTDLGDLTIDFDVVSYLNDAADFFAGVNGSLTVTDGVATSNLTTPAGDLIGTFDLFDEDGLAILDELITILPLAFSGLDLSPLDVADLVEDGLALLADLLSTTLPLNNLPELLPALPSTAIEI